MLAELRVKNFALIKDLSVHFQAGLNVITGETGAGKSLVLKSLHLLMGGKAPSDIVGNFSTETLVEGLFSISNRSDLYKKLQSLSYITSEEDSLLVRRIISSKGKSKTYINGSLATVSDLKEIVSPLVELSAKSEPLIELTSQHDNKNLQNPPYQRDLYDVFCKNRELRFEISKLYSLQKEKERELDQINQSDADRLQKIDFLNFQLSELDEFSPKLGEYEELKDSKKKQFKIEKFKEVVFEGEDVLNNNDKSVLSQLYSFMNEVSKVSDDFTELEDLSKSLEEASQIIETSVSSLRNLRSLQADTESEMSFEDIDERLKTYEHLFRKYNTDAEGLTNIFDNLSTQRSDLEQIDEHRLRVQKELHEIKENLNPLLQELSKSRISHKNKFEKLVNSSLKDLNMKDITFKVKFEKTSPSEFGQESTSFWLSHSKSDGQERSIKKAASGGELSRLLLAIKGALENQEAPRTYLFDEIDAGVSGPTAEKVGKKLRTLSKGQQVITITHLPQVAALGEHHFLIEKTSGMSGHQTNLISLNGDERVAEVARLISGEDITKASLAHATELIELH
ncbi:MAG: DNA repair protein RecN [Bdellovibrionales bacterium]